MKVLKSLILSWYQTAGVSEALPMHANISRRGIFAHFHFAHQWGYSDCGGFPYVVFPAVFLAR